MVIYKSRFLTRGEVWFDEEPGDVRAVDWIFYTYRSCYVPGTRWRHCHTYVINLAQNTDNLWDRLSSDTAYKIRRARDKDKITCQALNPADPGVIDAFERMYNRFAPLKGLLPLDRGRLESINHLGALDLSAATDTLGNILVFHANYRDRHRASQMFLPSLYRAAADSGVRNAIGRANRYLTWSDILRYKQEGLQSFDFGGWYTGTDTEMLKINEFKRGFGGEVVRKYKCEQVRTFKARLVLLLARLRKEARGLAAG